MKADKVYLEKKKIIFYLHLFLTVFFLLIMSYSFSSSLLEFIRLITGNSIIVITLFCLFFYLSYFIFTLGLKIYDEFILRPKYAQPQQSFKQWRDRVLKKEIKIFCFFLFFSQVAYYFLESDTTTWWIPTALICFFTYIFTDKFFWRYLTIMFYRKIDWADESRKEYLRSLAGKIGFSINDIVLLRDYKLKPQAMLVGFEPGRKLFINENSVQYAKEEIGVIFTREAAYHYYGYVWKFILIPAIAVFFGFYLVSVMFEKAAGIFKFEFLFYISTVSVLLLLLFFVFLVFFLLSSVIKNNIEKTVDLFILQITNAPDAFISVLIRETDLNIPEENFILSGFDFYLSTQKRINIAQDYAQSMLLREKRKNKQ
ncbi:MAG: hypothetical protein ABIG64_08325 [Candidatus Omnitrophota bacterium]